MTHAKSPWPLTAALTLAACGLREGAARGVARHTYHEPCGAVADATRETLRDRGYDLRPEDGPALELATEWRVGEPVKAFTIQPRWRYVARLLPVGAGGCQLRAYRESTGGAAPSSERDLGLEWEVLRRADPAEARWIESGAR